MYISIRDALLCDPALGMPADTARALGVGAVEIALRDDFTVCAMDSKGTVPLRSAADAAAYRSRVADMGLRLAAFLTSCDFSVGPQTATVDWVVRAIERAQAACVPVVRIDSAMAREREFDFETRVGLFAEGLAKALARTDGAGVALGIENHGFQGNNLAFLLHVFRGAGSPRLGVTLDTGNFYWRGYPLSEVYGILALLAPHAKHTHLKNIRYPDDVRETVREAGWEYEQCVAPLDEGDIDHAKVVRLLDAAGYDGDLCIEDESLGRYPTGEERFAVLQRDVCHVRAILDALR